MLPVCAVMIAFGPFFLEFFGHGYSEAYWALVVLAVGNMVFAFFALGIPLYQFSGHERTTVILMSTLAALCVGGMIILGSLWSQTGVALSTVIALNLGVILVSVLGWRGTRNWPPVTSAEKTLVSNT